MSIDRGEHVLSPTPAMARLPMLVCARVCCLGRDPKCGSLLHTSKSFRLQLFAQPLWPTLPHATVDLGLWTAPSESCVHGVWQVNITVNESSKYGLICCAFTRNVSDLRKCNYRQTRPLILQSQQCAVRLRMQRLGGHLLIAYRAVAPPCYRQRSDMRSIHCVDGLTCRKQPL